MKMTQNQAVTYCGYKAQSSLNGTHRGVQGSLLWQRLREEIERDGLDTVEQACIKWRDDHTDMTARGANLTWTLYTTFLDALYDDEKIEWAIACDLLVKVKGEIERRADWPLRVHYLSCFRNHLENVLNGSTNLGAYEDVRAGIDENLRRLEGEYGQWIDEALKAQE